MRESAITKQLAKRAREMGGELRKVRWEGRRGAPDYVLMLPGRKSKSYEIPSLAPRTIWVETKATGVGPEDYQLREHTRMRAKGQRVEVVDSFERIEEILQQN